MTKTKLFDDFQFAIIPVDKPIPPTDCGSKREHQINRFTEKRPLLPLVFDSSGFDGYLLPWRQPNYAHGENKIIIKAE